MKVTSLRVMWYSLRSLLCMATILTTTVLSIQIKKHWHYSTGNLTDWQWTLSWCLRLLWNQTDLVFQLTIQAQNPAVLWDFYEIIYIIFTFFSSWLAAWQSYWTIFIIFLKKKKKSKTPNSIEKKKTLKQLTGFMFSVKHNCFCLPFVLNFMCFCLS